MALDRAFFTILAVAPESVSMCPPLLSVCSHPVSESPVLENGGIAINSWKSLHREG